MTDNSFNNLILEAAPLSLNGIAYVDYPRYFATVNHLYDKLIDEMAALPPPPRSTLPRQPTHAAPAHAPRFLIPAKDRIRKRLADMRDDLTTFVATCKYFENPHLNPALHSLNKLLHNSHIAERHIGRAGANPAVGALRTIQSIVDNAEYAHILPSSRIRKIFADKGTISEIAQSHFCVSHLDPLSRYGRLSSFEDDAIGEILLRPSHDLHNAPAAMPLPRNPASDPQHSLPTPEPEPGSAGPARSIPATRASQPLTTRPATRATARATSTTLPDTAPSGDPSLEEIDNARLDYVGLTQPDIELVVAQNHLELEPVRSFLSIEVKGRAELTMAGAKAALDLRHPGYRGPIKSFIRRHQVIPMRAAFIIDSQLGQHEGIDSACVLQDTRAFNEQVGQEWQYMVQRGQTWGKVSSAECTAALEIAYDEDPLGDIVYIAYFDATNAPLPLTNAPDYTFSMPEAITLTGLLGLEAGPRPLTHYFALSERLQKEYEGFVPSKEMLGDLASARQSRQHQPPRAPPSNPYSLRGSDQRSLPQRYRDDTEADVDFDAETFDQLAWICQPAPPGFFDYLSSSERIWVAQQAHLALVRDSSKYEHICALLGNLLCPVVWLDAAPMHTVDVEPSETLPTLRIGH